MQNDVNVPSKSTVPNKPKTGTVPKCKGSGTLAVIEELTRFV
jgi:hypothetical protein